MEQTTTSFILLIWLCISTFAYCVILKGYDLEYTPTSSDAPRALLINKENGPLTTLATNAFTICLVAKLQDFSGLTDVYLFSFSSRQRNLLDEMTLDLDYVRNKTYLFINGTARSFAALPPLVEWFWLCVSWESKTGNANFYINGQQAGATEIEQGYEFGGEGYFVLGQRQRYYNSVFDSSTGVHGKLSNFNLWNRVLTLNEVQQVQKCQLEGNVVNWSESNWELYDNIQRVDSEDMCGRTVEPLNTNCNTALETIQTNFRNYTNVLQSQMSELQQKINARENTGKNECGGEVVRVLMNNYENYSSAVNSLKQRTDESEKEITKVKQQLTEKVQEINNLNKNGAVQSQEINNLKPRIEECYKEVASLKEKTARLSQRLDTLLQQNGKSQIDVILEAMNSIIRMQEALNLLLQKQPNKLCPSDYINLDGHCYYFETSSIKSWKEAADFCQSKSPNSKLLSIDSKAELDRIQTYLNSDEKLKTHLWWWTSGSDQAKEGSWMWTGVGKPFSYNFWCTGEPNNQGQEHCAHAVLYPNDICLNDRDCGAQLNVICEAE